MPTAMIGTITITAKNSRSRLRKEGWSKGMSGGLPPPGH